MDFPCPFVYARGKRCTGEIDRVEAYKADIVWAKLGDSWELSLGPRSHYHVFCSLKNDHAGYKKSDDSQMKFYWDDLPSEFKTVLLGAALTEKVLPRSWL